MFFLGQKTSPGAEMCAVDCASLGAAMRAVDCASHVQNCVLAIVISGPKTCALDCACPGAKCALSIVFSGARFCSPRLALPSTWLFHIMERGVPHVGALADRQQDHHTEWRRVIYPTAFASNFQSTNLGMTAKP